MIRLYSTNVCCSLFVASFLWLTPSLSAGQGVDVELGDFLNQQLANAGADYRVHMAETYTYSDRLGRSVFFSDRTKQLPAHFVPGDPRRDWSVAPGSGDDITTVTDFLEGSTWSGLTAIETSAAISEAMHTWNSVQSSRIPITDFGPVPFDLGYVQFLFGFGGMPFIVADITHGGFLPRGFFDALEPGGGDSILGVTFTFVWFDGADNPTDINDDGKIDVAFRETYYNDWFYWTVDGVSGIDVETVALHEAGHALSQGHFGAAFLTQRNSKLHFSPRAVMNAGYSGLQRQLTGTDIGGHSSIWSSWPRR